MLNFAAESHVDRSITNPEHLCTNKYSRNVGVINAAKKIGVKKYLQVSTDEVYGTLGETGLFHGRDTISSQTAHIVQVRLVQTFLFVLTMKHLVCR